MTTRRFSKSLFLVWTLVAASVTSVPVSGRFAEYRQVFDVKVAGSGPPVLLVPGLATTGAVWDSTVARLQDRYETHVLTLAGFGGPEPLGEPFLPRVAGAIVEYAGERRLRRPVIVGHSLGGFVAFMAASQAPGAFGGVVAVDGVPFLPALANPRATPTAQREQAAAMKRLYGSMTPEQFLMQTRLALSSMITDPADVERAAGWSAQSDPGAVGVAVAEMMTTDLRERAARISAPVLLVGALGAAPAPMHQAFRAAYQAQVAAVPDASVRFAGNAKHFVMLDDPAFFFQALESFLLRVHAAGARTPSGGGGD